MIKIALVMLGKGEAQSHIVDGFSALHSYVYPRECQIDEFISEDATEGSVYRLVQKLFPLRHDLFVTIGPSCSVEVLKIFSEIGIQRPVIFTAINDPVEWGIMRDKGEKPVHVTGVIMESPAETLPVEVVLRIFGLGRRYVFISRDSLCVGRTKYVAYQTAQYLIDRMANVINLAIGKGVTVGDSVEGKILEGDVVVVPETCLHAEDMSALRNICSEIGAEFFSGNASDVPQDAICGFTGDIQMIGGIAAELAKKILIDNVSPADIPVQVLEDVTQLKFNYPALARNGVSLPTNDFTFSLPDGRSYKCILRLLYVFMLPYYSVLETRIADRLLRKAKTPGEGLECEAICVDGLTSLEEYAITQSEYVVGMDFPFIVVVGHERGNMVQHAMRKLDKYKPMMMIRFDDDIDEPELAPLDPRRPESAYVMHVDLPSLKPQLYIEILLELQPDARKIVLPHSFAEKHRPPRLLRMIAGMRDACRERDVEFVACGSGDEFKLFETMCEEQITSECAVLSLPEYTRSDASTAVARICHDRKVFFFNGDHDRSALACATLGMSFDPVTDDIFDDVVQASWEKQPSKKDRSFTVKQLYRLAINVDRMAERGLKVAKNMKNLCGIPVVFVTSEEAEEEKKELASAIFRKPVVQRQGEQ